MKRIDINKLEEIIDQNKKHLDEENNILPVELDHSIIENLCLYKKGIIYASGSYIFFYNCIFIETDVFNTAFVCDHWTFSNSIFIKSNLSKLFIPESEIKGCKFIECNLFEMNLEGALIEDSIFLSCDFSAADFDEATIKKTKFINNYNLSKEYGFKNIIEDCNVWENV